MYMHLYVLTFSFTISTYIKLYVYNIRIMFCSVPGDRERRKVRGSKAQTTNTSHMVQHSYHMQLTLTDIVSAMRQCVHQPSAHSGIAVPAESAE
jgi:hypothetical protein